MTIPKLWGDGVHDDHPALQAVQNGEPIEIMNDCAHWTEDGKLYLHAKTTCFLGSRVFTKSPDLRFAGATIKTPE